MNQSHTSAFRPSHGHTLRALEPAHLAPSSPAIEALAAVWQAALGDELSLSIAFLTHRLLSPPLWPQAATLAETADGITGFILVHAPQAPDQPATTAHVDAWVVHPAHQRQGIGRSLLEWAIAWAKEQGCTNMKLGQGPLRLLPGVPLHHPETDANLRPQNEPEAVEPNTAAACAALGFTPHGAIQYDLAADLTAYMPPDVVEEIPGLVRPTAQNERDYVREFLHERVEPAQGMAIAHFLATRGRMSDLMALWTEAGLVAAAQLIVEDSVGGIEPWYPYTLAKPWSALRLITPPALDPALAAALLDATLRRLHNMGINSCILGDITDPTPYQPFGFTSFRRYQPYTRPL